MTIRNEAAQPGRGQTHLASLVRTISYEVMPFKKTEAEVLEYVPASVPLTVTATEAKESTRRLTSLSRVLTQICFDTGTTAHWAAGIAASGIGLPVYVGIPGPVNRQKLMRISAGIGLGQSARFLQKQQGLLWRFLLPGSYNPARLARRHGAAASTVDSNIRGLHIFTFNELRHTELWRRQLLDSVLERGA